MEDIETRGRPRNTQNSKMADAIYEDLINKEFYGKEVTVLEVPLEEVATADTKHQFYKNFRGSADFKELKARVKAYGYSLSAFYKNGVMYIKTRDAL